MGKKICVGCGKEFEGSTSLCGSCADIELELWNQGKVDLSFCLPETLKPEPIGKKTSPTPEEMQERFKNLNKI